MKKSKESLEILVAELEKRATNLLTQSKQFSEAFDKLLEGVQIIDFNWKYVYVNKTLADYEKSTPKKIIGRSLHELHPGIESTPVYVIFHQCMLHRTSDRAEISFRYPDQVTKWFEITIEPIDEGLLILSLDITHKKQADEKMNKANHLLAFISQVNQNIVRVKDEPTLFRNACRMALEFGKFKMAWIGLFDRDNKRIMLADQSGIPPEEISLFTNAPFQDKGPQYTVAQSGNNYICNDIAHDIELADWKPFAKKHGISSCMILPIIKSGKIIGTFNLYSTERDFLSKAEIDLLEEVTRDISFALDLLEKERKHKITEDLVIKNEKQFRHTLDNMLEGIQIHDFNWRYTYVNNALVNYSTYTREGLLGFTMMEKYPGIEQVPLFKAMERCMKNRISEHLETEFTFPDGKKAYFELSIQPIPEGIFILSVDRSEQKKAKEKLLQVNRLYSFISAINQSIVHIDNEEDLLNKACSIALEIGKFQMAQIDLVDTKTNKLNIVSIQGTEAAIKAAMKHSGMDYRSHLFIGTPTGRVLDTGKYSVNNAMQDDPSMLQWKQQLVEHNVMAGISLPITKFGKVIGVFGLHSNTKNFFDEEEISLLEEAATDLSFALEHFEKAKKHRITEELVVKNEIRFRSLIEKSADMITLVNANGELMYASPAVTKVLGYTADELLHKSDSEFIHPDDLPSFIRETTALLKIPGKSFSNEQRLLHKNGSWMWCAGTVTNLLHQEGVHAIVSNFRNISEQKSLEQQRDFDKNNLDALINNTSDLMWSVDREYKLITFNNPLNTIVRLSTGKELVIGDHILSSALSDEQRVRFKGFYERAFMGEEVTEIEHFADPVQAWAEISYYPIRSNELIIGAACHSRDITNIKKAEKELNKSEAFNRGVLNSLNSHIAVVDQTGTIIAVNEVWEKFAIKNGDAALLSTGVGANYFIVCEKSSRDGVDGASDALKGLKDVMREKRKSFYLEYPCHSPVERRWFSMTVIKFDSEERMVVVAHQNITDRKLAKEELVVKNQELQKANTELDRFVYSASHDLRAPLCSVLGLVTLVEMESKEINTLDYVHKIRASVNRLDGFIKNILSYSKNNRLKLIVSHISIKHTVDEIVNSLRYMKEAENVTFDIIIDETQPFYSDIHRFTIVLENLISNSIKFQDYARKERWIRIRGKSTVDQFTIEIADNGIGVAREYQPMIFDMFFRISGDQEGSGIGLYIVKETVEKLQGIIEVFSHEHEGTTFTVRLNNLIPKD